MEINILESHAYTLFELCVTQAMWGLRERLAEGLMHDGYCYKYDVSLPLSVFYQLVVDMRQRLDGSATRVVGYGHVGDGRYLYNLVLKVMFFLCVCVCVWFFFILLGQITKKEKSPQFF